MPRPTTSNRALDHLQQKWSACFAERQALENEVKALRAELAEADRKRQIAVRNAYEDGFNAGREDTQAHYRHVVKPKVSK